MLFLQFYLKNILATITSINILFVAEGLRNIFFYFLMSEIFLIYFLHKYIPAEIIIKKKISESASSLYNDIRSITEIRRTLYGNYF